jgi:glycerophosphoryl diester phosphodiesterase
MPVVIAHRGASGYLPEHTLEGYALAIEQGADYIEPDLVMTRDGVLVARHENEIGGTTDVAAHPEFAARHTRKVIDGVPVEGWFTEDFTLAELRTLRARERIPHLRPSNARHDGRYLVPTLAEIIALAQAEDARRAAAAGGGPFRRIGLYPETKHPSWFRGLGLPMEALLVRTLHDAGYSGREAPVFLQSFEMANLRELRGLTELPLVQLIEAEGAPWDCVAAGAALTYAGLLTAHGLSEVASYADAIGPYKALVLAPDEHGLHATGLVARAHDSGLQVHPWTFRLENEFLPPTLRGACGPADPGRLEQEIRAHLAAGVDAFFTDHPDLGARVRDAMTAQSAAQR